MSDEQVAGTEEQKDETQPGIETFTTKADKTEGARTIELKMNVGKDINEMVELFGAEVIYSQARKALIIAVQANVRRMLLATNEDGSLKYSDDAIQTYVNSEYKPGIRAARGTSEGGLEKLIAKLMKLPADKRKAALEALMADM
jgi:hypothetical protein